MLRKLFKGGNYSQKYGKSWIRTPDALTLYDWKSNTEAERQYAAALSSFVFLNTQFLDQVKNSTTYINLIRHHLKILQPIQIWYGRV